MKKYYTLLCLITIFSCVRQEEMVDDTNISPIYSENQIEVSAEVGHATTKAFMGEKEGDAYPFLWQSTGESVILLERASLVGREDYSAFQNITSLSRYQVSEDGSSADFSFYLKELTNGDAFEYSCISPASCFVSAGEEGLVLEVPASQTPAQIGPDPAAVVLWTKLQGGYSSQPSSLSFADSFTHPLAYVNVTVKNLPLNEGETVSYVTLDFDQKAVTGQLAVDWKGGYEPKENTHSFVNMAVDTEDNTFSVCFAALPFSLVEGDKISVKIATSESVLTREINLSKAMTCPSAEMTSFGVDMSSAHRASLVMARLASGQEYTLDEVKAGIYEMKIPYAESEGLTFIYKGAEYGAMASSGSGMVGTHSSGKHLSRTIGRLAVGGSPVRMETSAAETVLVRLDASYEDNIPRYYLELPQTQENVIFHEDFSLMVWGGDYYTWSHGISPDKDKYTASTVDGTEVADISQDYTQCPFGNKAFDPQNNTYITNRGLTGWDFVNCGERPFAIQVGFNINNGAGSMTTPAFTALTSVTDVNVHIDMARFATNSSDVKLSIEIVGSGIFEKSVCTGSRDAYSAPVTTNGVTVQNSYVALQDEPLSDYDVNVGEKLITTTSNAQGNLFPRATVNTNTFKPHTRLKLRICGADASTQIKIYGEAKTARFTIFDIKVVKDEGHVINGTVIDESSTLYGVVRDNSTGKPLAGVPMTDGFTYVTTDANGVYQMKAHEQARCVYPSIPAEYEIPLGEDGQPQIYKYVTEDSSRYDFYLNQRTESWNDFTIMAITDVHFYTSGVNQTNEEDKFKQYHVPDMVNYLSSASASGEISKNVIVVSLGDNTSNYTEKLPHIRNNLYSLIQMNGKRLPMFHAIGNHDHRGDGLTDFECTQDFVNVFGPTDYSINIGNAHIVFMDNTMCVEAEQPKEYGKAMAFERGLTDEQWAWLQADLANVKNKEDKLFIMCVHAPITSTTYSHFADIRNQLKTFGESHIMSGHLHKEIIRDFTDGWTGKKGRISQEHNLLAMGGSWDKGWKNKLSIDGTPMGYNVFNISGNMIKESIYNPVGQNDDYQFRIYIGGDKYENDKTITRDGVDVTYKFDWTSHFQEKYDGAQMDMSGKFVVRVFAAGSRQKYWEVYLVDAKGNRTKMDWHNKEIRDQCALAYFYVKQGSKDKDYASTTAKNVWTVDVPEAYKSDPEKAFSEGGYKVVAEYKSPGGKVFTYENNHVQSTKKTHIFGDYYYTSEYYYNGFAY